MEDQAIAQIERRNPDSVHTPVGEYSHLARVKCAELIFLAGQVAVDPEGNFVGKGDIRAQARQIYDNIGRLLEDAGTAWDNVVQLTTYIVGRENVPLFLEERTKIINALFPEGDFPPSTLLLIDGLFSEAALAEVTTVAAIP